MELASAEAIDAHLAMRDCNLPEFQRVSFKFLLDLFHHIIHSSKGLQRNGYPGVYATVAQAFSPEKKIKVWLSCSLDHSLAATLSHTHTRARRCRHASHTPRVIVVFLCACRRPRSKSSHCGSSTL